MVKRITIIGLVFTLLFGMAAPLLAGLEVQEQACEMSCCMVGQTGEQQAQDTETVTSPDTCNEVNSCLPGDKDTPESLDIEAEAPNTRVNSMDVPVLVVREMASTVRDKADKLQRYFREVISNLFESSREKLTKHSILII